MEAAASVTFCSSSFAGQGHGSAGAFEDAFRACSWPAATPSRLRPEPPKPPSRKPTAVSWEVPPLELPASGTRARALSPGVEAERDEESSDSAEGGTEAEEACVFALNGESCGSDPEDVDAAPFRYYMLGLDACDSQASTFVEKPRGEGLDPAREPAAQRPSPGVHPPLGASPVLLSALERAVGDGSAAPRGIGSAP